MSLERVKIDIVEKARHAASLKLIEAKKKAKEILAESERKLSEARAQTTDSNSRSAHEIMRQESARAELEGKKAVLAAKKEVIDEVFANAKDEMMKSNADIVPRLLEQAKKEIAIEYVYCNKKDSSMVKKYKVKESAINGGIIAENKEQTIRIDLSLDTLFSQVRDNYLDEVAATLFE